MLYFDVKKISSRKDANFSASFCKTLTDSGNELLACSAMSFLPVCCGLSIYFEVASN